MHGSIAQLITLTCHGNASLQGRPVPDLVRDHPTFKFCDYVHFLELSHSKFGNTKKRTIARNPNDWFAFLNEISATGIRLSFEPAPPAKTNQDRLEALANAEGEWTLQVTDQSGQASFWLPHWHLWNQKDPDRRIWRVEYSLVRTERDPGPQTDSLSEVSEDFKQALLDIYEFSRRHGSSSFTDSFQRALSALQDPQTDTGFHKDVCLPGQLTPVAVSLIKAVASSYLYGRVGSWTDLQLKDPLKDEHLRVSESHYAALNEAILAVASSTHRECD